MVELGQAGTDARAPRPVGDTAHDVRDRNVGVALLERTRDRREPRSKDKTRYAYIGTTQGVREMQKHSGIAGHRARDVGEHDHRAGTRAWPPPSQDGCITTARTGFHGGTPVELPRHRGSLRASRADTLEK